jgi:hypothetical protein
MIACGVFYAVNGVLAVQNAHAEEIFIIRSKILRCKIKLAGTLFAVGKLLDDVSRIVVFVLK